MTAPAGLPRLERTAVMGVLNVTPDSFSDGGAFFAERSAIEHGLALLADGADYVDVGGESTRPGAGRVDAAEESRRVLGVVAELARAGAIVSIDTTRAQVAAAALDAGACIVNDTSGGAADPEMYKVVAAHDAPFVLMHSRGPSADMADRATYDDVVGEVIGELRRRMAAAVDAGVAPERIALDPGLGFAKTAAHNLALVGSLARLRDDLAAPLLIGASRKSFLGEALGGRAVGDRDHATQALTAVVAWEGVWAVRVHDVRPAADAVRVVAAVRAARGGSASGTSDRIEIRGLRARGRHGVLPSERVTGQPFVVDAVLFVDARLAARTDNLADTVDYGEITTALRDLVEGEPVDLIETLAGRLAEMCLRDERVQRAEVTVHKPEAPVDAKVDDVAVTVVRIRA